MCIRKGRIVVPRYPPLTTAYPLFFTSHSPRVTSHVFSSACRLFGLSKKVNSFAIKQIQPLFGKHPGWGVPFTSPCWSQELPGTWGSPRFTSPLATRHSPLLFDFTVLLSPQVRSHSAPI